MIDGDSRYLSRCGEQVVHKAGVDDLALFVVDQALEEGSAYALRYTTMHLALDHHVIDNAPAVMHCCVLDERDHACLRVNLDNCPMHAAGKAGMWWTVKLGCLKPRPPRSCGSAGPGRGPASFIDISLRAFSP